MMQRAGRLQDWRWRTFQLGAASPLIAVLTAFGLLVSSRAGAQTQAKKIAAKPERFEVASIRVVPRREAGFFSMSPPRAGLFTMHHVSLAFAIAWAFGVDSNRMSGGPAWINDQEYDIAAKPDGNAGLSYKQLKPLVQNLLEHRFHLTYHFETQKRKGYALVAVKGGPKLTPSKSKGGHLYILPDRITAQNASVSTFAAMLESTVGRPVVDGTGGQGNYDFDVKFAPLDAANSALPSIFTALREQYGLKLQSRMVPVEVLVIDHVDRTPTPN